MLEHISRRKHQKRNQSDDRRSDEILGNAASNQASSVDMRKVSSNAGTSRNGPDDDIDLSSEERGYISRVKYIKPMYSPSNLGTVRLPTAAELGYDMQFGRVLSDSSDSESTATGGSHSYGMNDGMSGSDIPSNEEEDDDDDSEDVKRSKVDLISRMNALRKLQKEVGMKIQGGAGENDSRKNSNLRPSDQYDTVTDKEKNSPKGTEDDTENEKLWKHERLQFQEYERVRAGFGSPTLLQRAPVLHSNLQSYISSRRTVPKKSPGSASASASASKNPYSTAHTSLLSAHTEHQYFPSKESRRITNQRRSKERRAGGSSRSTELCYDDYTLGHLSFSEIAAIALGATLSSYSIHPVPSGENTPSGDRPRLFTPELLEEFCSSVSHHMGLDGPAAALVTETLFMGLRPFECCPIATENCTLLIEMAKFAAISSEKTIHLDLGGFKFPLKRNAKKSSHSHNDKIKKGSKGDKDNEKENDNDRGDVRDQEESSAEEVEEDMSDGEKEDSKYTPHARAKVQPLSYPFSVHPDREPSRFFPSSGDSMFLGGAGVTGLLNLEGSPRNQKGGPALHRSERGRTSLLSPSAALDEQQAAASHHADVHGILKGQGQGQGLSASDKPVSDYITVEDIPNYFLPETRKRGSAEKHVVIDKRAEDQVQFSLISSMHEPSGDTSFHSIAFEVDSEDADGVKKGKEEKKVKTKMKELVPSKVSLHHATQDMDDSSDSGSIDMNDMIYSSSARTSGRTVSFDETASSGDMEDSDHERIHSPRFDPPLSPPPHHTDELPTNGHALESSLHCSDTLDRVIVIPPVEPLKVTAQSLSPSRTETGVKDAAGHSDKNATQMKLRARAEKELMKRGNHVAFEAEDEHENEYDDGVEDKGKDEYDDEASRELYANYLFQNATTNANTNINSSHYNESSVYPASALSQSASPSHAHAGSGTNDARDRVRVVNDELCGDYTLEKHNDVSHDHPQAHPAYGHPPLNADGTLNLTSNPFLNTLLTQSLEDVAKLYTGSSAGTGAGVEGGENLTQFGRTRSDEPHSLSQSRSLSKSSSMNDLDKKREVVEKGRASALRSYGEQGGSDGDSDELDEKYQAGYGEVLHSQYDSYAGDHSAGDPVPSFQGAAGHRQKGLHVHIKDIEVEEIPDHVFSPTNDAREINLSHDLRASDLPDLYDIRESEASPKKAKSRRKKKAKKEVEKEVEPKALHAPKHVTGKFTDIRASQDFRTGIYRSACRDPILSSPTSLSRRFSVTHRKVSEKSSSLSPSRGRLNASKAAAAGSKGLYGTVRHSLTAPTASTRSKSAVRARSSFPYTKPATAVADRRSNALKGTVKASASRKGPTLSHAHALGPVPVQGRTGDVMRKSVAVHVPSAIFSALSPLSNNYSDEEQEQQLEEEVVQRKEGSNSSYLQSPHSAQFDASEGAYQTHQEHAVRPSREAVRCASPYSPAAASRSGSPVLRTRSQSRDAYKRDESAQADVKRSQRKDDFESEVETEDFSNESSDSDGSPQSPYHLKDGNLRPKSAKGRRRSSENSSPHPSPSDAFRYQDTAKGAEQGLGQGAEQGSEEKHVQYSNQGKGTAYVEAPISSMYSPNISKHAEKDQLVSFSSLHFSRDAAFSQSLREVISQSVEGSFKKLLGPSFKSLLLGHATAQSAGKGMGMRKKSLSPASPSLISRDKDKAFLRGKDSPEGPHLHRDRDSRASIDLATSQQQQRQREHITRNLSEEKALGELDGLPGPGYGGANGHGYTKATKSSRRNSSSARILKDDAMRASSSSAGAVRPSHSHRNASAPAHPLASDATASLSPSPHKPLHKRTGTSASASGSGRSSSARGILKPKGKIKRQDAVTHA